VQRGAPREAPSASPIATGTPRRRTEVEKRGDIRRKLQPRAAAPPRGAAKSPTERRRDGFRLETAPLGAHESIDGGGRIEASCEWGGERAAAFPFPHTAAISARLEGATLWIETTVAAGPEEPVPVAIGFHPCSASAASTTSTAPPPPGERLLAIEPMTAPTKELLDGSFASVPAGGQLTAGFELAVATTD
jgi:hypothetical protein